MTLLTATSTLIDAAKTYGPESDRVLLRAIKRMEKRLEVLQLRDAKNRKRVRMEAFWDAMALFEGGKCLERNEAVFHCKLCARKIYFGDFCKCADYDGRGYLRSLVCPGCGCLMEVDPELRSATYGKAVERAKLTAA